MFARAIPKRTEALRLLSDYIGRLHALQLASPELLQVAVTHVYDLAALAIGATRDATEMAKDRGLRAARMGAIKADIRTNLVREALSINEIASRQRVTPRYIQMLFEGEGTTFTEFVLNERLMRAHRMLTDLRFADRLISTIAFDVGFGDLSSFNNSFRRRFGLHRATCVQRVPEFRCKKSRSDNLQQPDLSYVDPEVHALHGDCRGSLYRAADAIRFFFRI